MRVERKGNSPLWAQALFQVLFYLLSCWKESQHFGKTIEQCPTYLIFGNLGPLEHSYVPRNERKRDQRSTAVILNLALGCLWTSSILCSDKLHSGVFFRRWSSQPLLDCRRDLGPLKNVKINHWAKYSYHRASVYSPSRTPASISSYSCHIL